MGKRILRLRNAYGWSQRRLAEECGLSPAAIEKVVKSGSCRSDTLQKIRERTGVNLNWLVSGDEDWGLKISAEQEAKTIAGRTESK